MMKNERPLSKLAYLFRFALDLFTCIPFLFLTLSRLGVSVKLEVTEPKQKRTSPCHKMMMKRCQTARRTANVAANSKVS